MSGVSLETCWTFINFGNNKFYYKAVFCWYFYWIIYDARDHEYQISSVLTSIIRSSTTAVAASILTSYRGDSRAVVLGHEQQHDYHHNTKVKPEAATAVVELLMIGVWTPETCWAVNKSQDNKLEKLLHQVGDLFELYLVSYS